LIVKNEGFVEGKKNPRLLLMDDDDIIRDNMVELGEILNFDIVCARNGSEAVEIYRNSMSDHDRFSAVILDLSIKGDANSGGDIVLKELKRIDPNIKSILFSGYSDSREALNYREYGFDAVITKPVGADQFEKVVKCVIKKV